MTSAPLALAVQTHKALAHPVRLRMLAMLGTGELCVCQLTAVLELAASTVSAHLSELRRAGLVSERKDGRWVSYRRAETAAAERVVHEAMAALGADPQAKADARLLRELRRVPLETLCRADLDLSRLGLRRPAAAARPPKAARR